MIKFILRKTVLILVFISGGLVAQTPDFIIKPETGSTDYTVTGNVMLVAGQGITLKPGTWIKSGSTFVARITPDAYVPIVLSNENYIFTRSYQKAMLASSGIIDNSDVIENITYFDGLGRPMQSTAIKGSPDRQDLVTHIGYDGFGRQDKDYLPFVPLAGTTASYRTGADSGADNYYALNYPADINSASPNPFSQKIFEQSPLNRILKQASPGSAWAVNSGHEIRMDYQANIVNEVKLFKASAVWNASLGLFETDLVNPQGTVYYAAGEFYKTVTKDENWTSGNEHTTEEFKDKEGHVVLKKTYGVSVVNGVSANRPHETYYVYDIYGNLTFVIPPKADGAINALVLNDLCYKYRYDNRNRLVEKKLPGKDWEYIVYDRLDRPILTQDANLRTQNKWLFTKYDAFGRVVYTGDYKNTVETSRAAMQTFIDNGTTSLWETKQSTSIPINGTAVNYNNVAFPTINDTNINVFTINYYDDYSGIDLKGADTAYGITPVNSKGLATVTKVRILDTSSWITNVSYYDAKARPIYSYSKNDYLGTISTVKKKLDFIGKVLETTSTHIKNSVTTSIVDAFTYDHAGRLTQQTQAINGTATPEVIAVNKYNELGQLIQKEVGGKTTATNRLQTINYTYNIRGWLKGINDIDTIGSDLFAFKINYNDITDASKKLYNGNISQTLWKTNNTDSSLKSYTYSYDALNRLTMAESQDSGRYNESLGYDKNGNITNLIRKGYTDVNATTPGTMDNLIYTYNNSNTGNKLMKVSDSSGSTEGFKDGNTAGDDYSYDDNGNMTKDLNKGITNAISYNHLNLPTQITFATGNIQYVYDATGVKLEKKVTENGKPDVYTKYAGSFIYERTGTTDDLKFFSQPEGYVAYNSGAFDYIYQYKDHLGNIRLSYDKNLTVVEENNYYPFGLKQKGYNNFPNYSYGNAQAQKYKYNGKELQDEMGLGMYTYGFRDYDPAIGRWVCVDPLAEKSRRWSPYTFCINSPLRFIDPDGREIIRIEGGVKFTGDDAKLMFKNIQQQVKETGGIKGFHFVSESRTKTIYNDLLSAFKAGKPNVLHIIKDNPELKKENRDDAIGGYPNRKKEGLERQEYPYASTYEGGKGAYVTYVPEREQRVEGGQLSVLSRSLKDKDAFMVIPVPAEKDDDVVPYALPVRYPLPAPSADQLEKGVKPAVTTATILTIIGMILLSPVGI